MESQSVKEWNDIKDNYKDGSIIIGNGGSIAGSPDRFNYPSLYAKAFELEYIDSELKTIFSGFKICDFEAILRKLFQAQIVNNALKIDDQEKLTTAYQKCRETLIQIIRDIHPKYQDIDPAHFDSIGNFLKNFKTIISLNYDLILYWVIMKSNRDEKQKGSKNQHRFKDCFNKKLYGDDDPRTDNYFNTGWQDLRESFNNVKDSTLIFYLHGNLALADYISEDLEEIEVKITSPGKSLLDNIYEAWGDGKYSPLFICEGTQTHKLDAIQKSPYLRTIYHEVFKDLGKSLVIYGWSMQGQDDYVLEQLRKNNTVERIAVSLYQQKTESNLKIITEKLQRINSSLQIEFFDSASPNCWNQS